MSFISLIRTKIARYSIIAILLLIIAFYVSSLNSKLKEVTKQRDEALRDLILQAEIYESNIKLLESKVRVETKSKASKQVVIKTQNKLKKVIEKRGEINEVHNDNFINFSF